MMLGEIVVGLQDIREKKLPTIHEAVHDGISKFDMVE